MEPASTYHRGNALESRVRANAGSAGFGAACLLFFGFYYLARPAGSFATAVQAGDFFQIGSLMLNFTLRWGGIVMAILALASLSGKIIVLMIDAVGSMAVGGLLALSGVICLLGRGVVLTTLLLVVFGYLWIRSGWRNAQIYTHRRNLVGANSIQSAPIAAAPDSAASPFSHSDAGRRPDPIELTQRLLQERRSEPTHEGIEARVDQSSSAPPPAKPTPLPSAPVQVRPKPEEVTITERPPEGFLASFAPKDSK